jgi:hypothetical protein
VGLGFPPAVSSPTTSLKIVWAPLLQSTSISSMRVKSTPEMRSSSRLRSNAGAFG